MHDAGSRTPAPHADVDHEQRRGVRLAIVAYLLWGGFTVFWKQLAAFDARELIGWRIVSTALVLSLVTSLRRRWRTVTSALLDPGQVRRIAVAAGLVVVNWWSYVHAVVTGRVIETALGYFMAPLATMLLGVIVLHEQARLAQRWAFGLAAGAVGILTIAGGRVPWIALLIAASWSLYGLTKRHVPLGPIDGLTAEALVLFGPATVFVVLRAGRVDGIVQMATASDWPLVLATGIVTAVPLVLFAGAAKSVPFTLLGPLNLLVPIINFTLGWAWYGEAVPAWRFAGFALVWAAVVLVMGDRLRASRRAPSAPRPRRPVRWSS